MNRHSEVITEQLPEFLREDYELPVLYRYDAPQGRMYYKIEGNEIIMGPSVTTVTGSEVPKGERLIKATADRGYDQMIDYMEQEGHYGTILDILFHRYIAGLSISLHADDLRAFIINHLSTPRIEGGEGLDVWEFPEPINYWAGKLQQDLWGLSNWAADVQYEPIMVQTGMIHDEKTYAGAVDDYGIITASNNRGQNVKGESYRVLIDLKKSTGVYRDRVFQQGGYRGLIEYNCEEIPERYFILSPSSRAKQGYSFQEITDHPDLLGFDNILENYQRNPNNMQPNEIVRYEGTLTRGEATQVTRINVIDYLKEKHGLQEE